MDRTRPSTPKNNPYINDGKDKLVVTFEVDDTVDGVFGGVTLADDVIVVVPAEMIAGPNSGFDADDVMVQQDGEDVGAVSIEEIDGTTADDGCFQRLRRQNQEGCKRWN